MDASVHDQHNAYTFTANYFKCMQMLVCMNHICLQSNRDCVLQVSPLPRLSPCYAVETANRCPPVAC